MSKFILSNYIEPVFLKTNEMSCNSSTFKKNGKRYFISRNVTYFISKNTSALLDGRYHTRNFLYEIDDDGTLHFIKEMNTLNASNNCRYFGLEDVRTITWEDKVYFSCTKVLGNTDAATMCFGEIDDNLNFVNIKEYPTNVKREKNWAPIESMPFTYIYSFSPFKIVNIQERRMYDGPSYFNVKFSGSSPVIEYKDKLLALVHTKTRDWQYHHYFILMDKDLKPIKISEPFTFFGNKTEFCVDVKLHNDKICIMSSVNDGLSYMFEIDDSMLERILNKDLTDNNSKTNVYDRFLNDSLKMNAPEFISLQALYANNKLNIAEAIVLNHDKSRLPFYKKADIQRKLLEKLK